MAPSVLSMSRGWTAIIFSPSPCPPRPGALLSLSHPPGQPEALQTGTPGPLLASAIGSALVAALCASILLGV